MHVLIGYMESIGLSYMAKVRDLVEVLGYLGPCTEVMGSMLTPNRISKLPKLAPFASE